MVALFMFMFMHTWFEEALVEYASGLCHMARFGLNFVENKLYMWKISSSFEYRGVLLDSFIYFLLENCAILVYVNVLDVLI